MPKDLLTVEAHVRAKSHTAQRIKQYCPTSEDHLEEAMPSPGAETFRAPAVTEGKRVQLQQQNSFLSSLSEADLAALRPHLREIKLEHAQVLFEPGDRIEHQHFPTSGVVSFVVIMRDGNSVEAGMLGNDGVVGASAALDGPRALNRAIVQVRGSAMAIETARLRAAVAASEALREKLYQHDQLLWVQAQQSAACNALHQVEERLCRWMLRTADVVQSRTLELTQEFVGQMLGVRRTSVTLAARHLQALGLIKYRRGRVDLVDVDGLREASCECYEAFNQQRDRMFAASN
jgi:CRP-like cAMP-binding protein